MNTHYEEIYSKKNPTVSYSEYIKTEVKALYEYYKSEGETEKISLIKAGAIKDKYQQYAVASRSAKGARRAVRLSTFLRYVPDLLIMPESKRQDTYRRLGFSLKHPVLTIKMLHRNDDNKMELVDIVSGWERDDREWIDARDGEGSHYASMEARMLKDSDRFH